MSKSTLKCSPYIDAEGLANLHKYKYAGGDKGYAYIHFYNPLAMKLVTMVPESVAPNLLTMIGFTFATIPFVVLFGLYGTSFKNDPENPVPKWFFFLYALCYFLYRIFDKIGGK